MREKVNQSILESLKKQVENKETDISLNNGLLDIAIDGKEYKGLTPKEVAQKFGTDYYIVQNLRYLFEGDEIERTIQDAQSVKKEIIDIFIKTLEKNNIFEGIVSIEEIRERLEQNIDAVYVTNDTPFGKDPVGTFVVESKNIYIKGNGENLEEIRQSILRENLEDLQEKDLLGMLCHEIIHAISTNGYVSGFNDPNRRGFISINEGLTEILAKSMVPNSAKAYVKEVETTNYLLEVFGKEKIIEAYLNADKDSLINMAKEKDVLQEFIKIVNLSDEGIRALGDGKDTMEIYLNIDRRIADFINSIGNIDVSRFMEQNISLPEGIKLEIMEKGTREAFLKNEKFGETEYFQQLLQKYPILKIESIDSKNNGQINFEEYIKQNLVLGSENIIGQHFFEKGTNFKEYCKNIIGALELLEEYHGDDAQAIVNALLTYGVEPDFRDITDVNRFKVDTIDEIIYQDFGVYINTAKSAEEYSWKEMISRIEKFEYYTTEHGKFLVDTEYGEILGTQKNGEIINIEDIKLQEISSKEKNSNAIKYIYEDKELEVFLTEKTKEGKYILKGYIQNEEGEYTEIDVGLGRDFCDDTTEIDRQLIYETSEVRSGSIKEAAEKIKNEISKEKQIEKENVVVDVKKEDEQYID